MHAPCMRHAYALSREFDAHIDRSVHNCVVCDWRRCNQSLTSDEPALLRATAPLTNLSGYHRTRTVHPPTRLPTHARDPRGTFAASCACKSPSALEATASVNERIAAAVGKHRLTTRCTIDVPAHPPLHPPRRMRRTH